MTNEFEMLSKAIVKLGCVKAAITVVHTSVKLVAADKLIVPDVLTTPSTVMANEPDVIDFNMANHLVKGGYIVAPLNQEGTTTSAQR
jgi:hypothetical protein